MVRRAIAVFMLETVLLGVGCGEQPLSPRETTKPDLVLLIDRPPVQPGEQQYGKVVVFGWKARGQRAPSSTRYLSSAAIDSTGNYNPSFDIVRDLNENPSRYDTLWSQWMPYGEEGDSSRLAVVGKDEPLIVGRHYIFAVQARDEDGSVTDTFMANVNVRRYRVKSSTGPILRIFEQYLVGFRFIGRNMYPATCKLPPGVPLEFRWLADASDYAGEIEGYRYGWDVADLGSWDVPFERNLTRASKVSFSAGVHTLFVEALDIAGSRVLGRVTIEILQWPMDRNLLMVDDYRGATSPLEDYSYPSEEQDDEFWNAICSRAQGFDPHRDAYDCASAGGQAPPMGLVGKYKNIIWNYHSSGTAWSSIMRFVPESKVGIGAHMVNCLRMFLMLGGHIWTLGHSDREGGLAATLASPPLTFPRDLECEILQELSSCSGSRIGASTMAYRDYCISVIDKIDGLFRTDASMPPRARDHVDVLVGLKLESNDPLASISPAMPEHVSLWEEVTRPGRRFDPADSLGPGGLTYVEIYNPEYWMIAREIFPQPCFRPMYRMDAKGDSSAVEGATVALWVTRFSEVVPDVASGVGIAAPSVHFGFPLWYFRRSAVDSIADAIFSRWAIAK